MVGRTTSGVCGHTAECSLALAYVSPEADAVGMELIIDILGSRRTARVIPDSPHAPGNERLRS